MCFFFVLFSSHCQEKNTTTPGTAVDKGCCLDFTHPCKVPAFPSTSETARKSLRPTWLKTEPTRNKHDKGRHWTFEYGKGGLLWPYGGSGTFLSAGLLELVQQGSGGTGWETCTEVFAIGYDTDIQVLTAPRGSSPVYRVSPRIRHTHTNMF